MNRYFIRAVKYLVWLVILFFLVFTLMIATGTSRLGAEESLTALFGSQRGLLMLGMILILSLLYPKFGYTTCVVKANLADNRDNILKVFDMGGYKLESESPGRMVFRAESPVRKALMLWEDTIVVTADDNYIFIDGIRKETVRAEFRLKSFLQ